MKLLKALSLSLSLLALLPVLAQAREVPIADFFRDAQFETVTLSPDGKHMAVTVNHGDRGLLAVLRVSDKQLVLSESLANPTRMVQIAMALKSIPFDDIVFVQYPTRYTDGGNRVVPRTSSAEVLFQALQDNKALTLTGDARRARSLPLALCVSPRSDWLWPWV